MWPCWTKFAARRLPPSWFALPALPVCCQRCELSTLAPITKPGACCHPWSDGDGLLALWSCKPKVNLFCKLSWLWCLSQQQESNQYTNLLNTFREFWKSVSLHCPGKSGTYDYPVLISGVAEVRGLWLQAWLIKFYLCEIVLCGSNLIISSQYWLSSMTDCFCDVMLNCLMISVVFVVEILSGLNWDNTLTLILFLLSAGNLWNTAGNLRQTCLLL